MRVKFVCEECGNPLQVLTRLGVWGDIEIKVSLCASCVEDADDIDYFSN